jgi:hypothetical protein
MAKSVVSVKGVKKTATGAPQLTYRGGPLLANVEVTTIYWGSAWANDPIQSQLDGFFDFIVGSSLIDQLAEYSINNFNIGHGSHVQTFVLSQDPPSTVDDVDIAAFVQNLISNGTLPPQNANSLYFVFTPAGVTVTLQGSASCVDFCGYHNSDPTGTLFYAVVPYPNCSGCQFAGTLFDSATVIASHEFCESITDPIPGSGWYDDANGEIGDICEGSNKIILTASAQAGASAFPTFGVSVSPTSITLDGASSADLTVTLMPNGTPSPPPPPTGQSYVVQMEWSNAQGSCV